MDLRTRIETFSREQNLRLIRALRPKRILMLGMSTLDRMGQSGFEELVAIEPVTDRPRRARLLQAGQIEGVQAFAIPHPSMSYTHPTVTNGDWSMIMTKMAAASVRRGAFNGMELM